MIGSWLVNCISQNILKHTSGFKIVKEAWRDLDRVFCIKFKGYIIIQLRQELLKISKCNLSVNKFVLKLREIRDQLELDGYAQTKEDKLSYLIAGLDHDFESVVSTIAAKMQNEVVTIADAIALLLGYESWLASRISSSNTGLPSVNVAQHSRTEANIVQSSSSSKHLEFNLL